MIKPFHTILLHKLNSHCNTQCIACDRWQTKPLDDMNALRVCELLKKAKDAGIRFYTIWGGEPLLYPELEQVLKKAKQLKLHTIICTNGLLGYVIFAKKSAVFKVISNSIDNP